MRLGLRGTDAHPRGDRLGDGGHGLAGGTGFTLGDGRDPDIATLTHGDVERDAAEVLEAMGRREPLPARARRSP